MLDVGYSELLMTAIVALLVVGPKELPNLLRQVGRWVGRARSLARQFRAGFDEMVREAEIEEMNRRWQAQMAEMESKAALPAGALTPAPVASASSASADSFDDEPPSGDEHIEREPPAPGAAAGAGGPTQAAPPSLP